MIMNRKILYSVLGVFFTIQSALPTTWIANGVKNELISPLMKAAKDGDVDKVTQLYKSNVDLAECSASNMTALHYAIGFQQEDAAIFLIKHGAPLHVLDKWDNTPLYMARKRNQKRIIEELEKQIMQGKRYQGLTIDDTFFILLIA
jgi:ankyrin repeat protein